MRESEFLDDFLALRSLSASGSSAHEDDSLPGHVERGVKNHVDRLASLLEDVLLLALGRDFSQLLALIVSLEVK